MKRIVACISLAMAMAVGATTYASTTYYSDNGVVDSAVNTYQTVLITKDGDDVTSDTIVYVDQADGDTFAEATKFLLKADATAAPGKYKITMGGTNVESPKEAYFTIGRSSLLKATDYAMTAQDGDKNTVSNDDNTVNKAFIYSGSQIDCKAIKVFATDAEGNVSSVGYNFDTALPAVEGSLQFGVEIQGISEAHKDNIQVYLSSEEVSLEEGGATGE